MGSMATVLQHIAITSGLPVPNNGALAQLVERLLCTQKVVGSIPTCSTVCPSGG